MAEPLQMKNEVIRASVNLHLLEGILVILAPRAVPLVIASEGLFLAEQREAIFQGKVAAAPEPASLGTLGLAAGGEVNILKVRGL